MSAIRCCKDCPDRHPICHDSCSKYQAEKQRYEAEKAIRNKQKLENQMFSEIRQDSARRTVRRRHLG